MIVELLSVGNVIDTETLITYPLYNEEHQIKLGKQFDENGGIHIDDIETDEWFNDLSDEDFGTVSELVLKR